MLSLIAFLPLRDIILSAFFDGFRSRHKGTPNLDVQFSFPVHLLVSLQIIGVKLNHGIMYHSDAKTSHKLFQIYNSFFCFFHRINGLYCVERSLRVFAECP